MDLRFTDDELAFREQVRAFLKGNLPDATRQKIVEGRHPSKDDMVSWTRVLNKRGWSVPHWPAEWGGTGWTPVQLLIFNDELQQAPAPEPLAFPIFDAHAHLDAMAQRAGRAPTAGNACP